MDTPIPHDVLGVLRRRAKVTVTHAHEAPPVDARTAAARRVRERDQARAATSVAPPRA